MEEIGQAKMTVYDFGRELLRTNDLDPVYILLWEAQLDRHLLCRWLLGYFCFYNVGTASWIASHYQPGLFRLDEAYWEAMLTVASSSKYPRGHERRHFRDGPNRQAATKSVEWLRKQGVDGLFSPFDWHYEKRQAPPTAKGVMDYVKTWEGFGPWIAFKVADMLERLDLCPVDFGDGSDIFLFDSPREGAELLWSLEGEPHSGFGDAMGGWAIRRILTELGNGSAVKLPLAPPRYERPIGPAECETMLCKGKAYLKGHYKLGEDIKACRYALASFSRCPLAQKLYRAGKKGGLW